MLLCLLTLGFWRSAFSLVWLTASDFGMLRVPWGCTLIPRGQVQDGGLVPGPRDHLQTHGQPVGVETTGHADRRQAVVVGEDRVLGGERLRVSSSVPERGDGRWNGGKKQEVEIVENLLGYGIAITLYILQPAARFAEGYGGLAHRVAQVLDNLDGSFERG